jgi:PAS domain S-box-containing protein
MTANNPEDASMKMPDVLKYSAKRARAMKAEQDGAKPLGSDPQSLDHFFDAAPIPLHWVGSDGTILGANRAVLNLLGYSKEEYLGRNIAEFHVDTPPVEDMLARFTRGETLRNYEARVRCKNGSIKHVLIDSNVLWENGTFIHAQCFTRDVTNQKRTEKELKALNATLEERVIQRSGYIRLLQEVAVAANEADAIETALQFAVDRICAYQDWPVGHAYVFSKEHSGQLLSKPIWNLKDSERFQPFKEVSDAMMPGMECNLLGRVRAEGKPVTIPDVSLDANFSRSKEAAMVGIKGGVAFPILIGKEVVAALEFFCDKRIRLEDELLKVMTIIGTQLGRVVERKRIEARLRESERLAAMGKTAAVFAHEVANPLNGLSTTCQLLQRHFAKHPDGFASSTVENIQTEINRLTLLLNNFRSLSRPQQLNLEKTDVTQLAKEVLTGAAVDRNSNVRFVENLSSDLPGIMADAEKLRQVFLNLYKNALEAMPDGGSLTLSGKSFGNYVIVEIEDTGVGIKPGSDIFELFTTTKPNGTGLGLAIVRQIMAAHSGTITYTSQPGKGTRFILTLPANLP